MKTDDSCALFDRFCASTPLTEEDKSVFEAATAPSDDEKDGMMAVAGLTVSLLENGWDEEKLLLLLDGAQKKDWSYVQERAYVGIVMAMITYDTIIRQSEELIDKLQDVLTKLPDLSYTVLCDIARTTKVERVTQFTQEWTSAAKGFFTKQGKSLQDILSIIERYREGTAYITRKHLDQGYAFFVDAWHVPFFEEHAANWFLPWTDDAMDDMDEEERERVLRIMELAMLCDSDKYALIRDVRRVSRAMGISTPTDLPIGELNIDVEPRELPKDVLGNYYTQQMYRYFQLSPFAKTKPFATVDKMRDTLVYRLVVVGTEAQDIIAEILSDRPIVE